MLKDKLVLSVVVPVYNVEKHVAKCINSILAQRYLDIEIIVVDDGSSDSSGSICDLLAKEYECISVIHIENKGLMNARLVGTRASRGNWITFVDADDWIEKGAYDGIFDNDCDIIVTGISRYYDEKRQLREMPYLEEGIYDKKKIEEKIIPIMLWNPKQGTWALDPSLCTKIFKRDVILPQLELALGVDAYYGEDSIVIFPMMLNVERIRIVKKIYYNHRQRKLGEISPYIKDKDFFSKLFYVYEYLKEQFKKTAHWELMENQLDCFYMSSVELRKPCCNYPVFEFMAYFPLDQVCFQSRVVLYGAGKIGKEYWRQNLIYQFCNIVSWVDQNYESCQLENCLIEDPIIIKDVNYDYVIIAVDNYYIAEEIVNYLKKLGVEEKKVVWHSVRVNQKKL